MLKALRYAKRLIGFDTTSSLSNSLASKYIERKLTKYGFVVEKLEYRDENGVKKVSVVGKKGRGTGGFAYFGHSDVVPAEQWFTDRFGPFEPRIVNERLYGRGACDMKGSLACMLEAIQLVEADELEQPIYFVCTADEEVGYTGAQHVVAESRFYREMVSAGVNAVIGEPTQLEIVHAHKGTFGFRAVSQGRAGHSSTREGINANLAMIPFLSEMKAIHDETEADAQWMNKEFDPPTVSWNIGINDNNRAINITAPESVCTVYFRPMPGTQPEALLQRAEAAAREHGLYFEVMRKNVGMYTDKMNPMVQTALKLAHKAEPVTVSYGTDGAVLGELENLVVVGPGSIAQAHTNNEWIELEQLALGTELYAKFIRHFCLSSQHRNG